MVIKKLEVQLQTAKHLQESELGENKGEIQKLSENLEEMMDELA